MSQFISRLYIMGSIFDNNMGNFFSNAITMMGSIFLIESSTFIRNHAFSNIITSGSSGTVEFINGLTFTVIKSHFIDNLKFSGGAISISIYDYRALIFFSDCTFVNNSATTGASVYILNLFKIEIFVYHCEFLLNYAKQSKYFHKIFKFFFFLKLQIFW